ncbi:hypothetical protein [Streptomyces sp. SAI-126]|uniref:hypothetical protein n=1 Tax=Streptomyces sp. SAI-126 TaxID=3377732 RepID=UPI003C7A04DC
MDLMSVGGYIGLPFGCFPGDEGIEDVGCDAGECLYSVAVEPKDVIRAFEFLAQQGVAEILDAAGGGVGEALEEVESRGRRPGRP